jgi:ferritin-like metal-binding protein YciE
MQLKSKIHSVRTNLSHRRTVRLAHKQLSRELAAFTTAADRAELDEMIERHPAEETRQIREILSRRAA